MAHFFNAQSTASLLPRRFEESDLDAELLSAGIDPQSFQVPNFDVQFRPQVQIQNTPDTAIVKGMFFENLARAARRFNVRCEPRYTAFRDYPMRDYMELIVRYAEARYPHVTLREAVRRVGWEAFPTLAESIAGRVMFAVAGRDLRAAINITPAAYRHSISGTVTIRHISEHQAVQEFRSIWNFPDCYQVGVMEGGCKVYERNHSVSLRVLSECDVDLLIRW
ncbi:MAG: DUF2378 family protein [Polyangiaceae bacterium]|nr:DUF2378 family protein [Polyangiaceae bacterium]